MPAVQTSTGNTLSATAGVSLSQPDSMIVVVQSGTAAPGTSENFTSGPTGFNQPIGQASGGDTTLFLNAGSFQTVTCSDLTVASILQVDWNTSATVAYQNGTVLNGGVGVNAGSQALHFGNLGIGPTGGGSFKGASPK